MKFGLFSTFMSPMADRNMIKSFAMQAEEIGVDSLWLGEHVVVFDEMEFPYPGSPDGKIPTPPGGGLLDTVATFGFLASITERLRFGTGISLISQRNPLYTAKEFATLDWLTDGRIDFGVGVGWCKEEVIASGYSWEDRGARSDEFLAMIKALWTQEQAEFSGEHFQLEPCRMDPKPVQKPHVPIFVGGHSKPALRRTAEYGDGWYGFQIGPGGTAKVIEELKPLLEQRGRSMDDVEVVITPTSDAPEAIEGFAEIGVTRLILPLGSQRAEKLEARLQQVAQLIRDFS